MGFYTVFYFFSIMEKLKKWLKMESLEPLFLFALWLFSLSRLRPILFLYLISLLSLSLLQLSPPKLYQILFLSPHTSVFFRFNHILINSLFKHKLTISVIPISCHNSDSRSLSFLLSLYDASNHNSHPRFYWSLQKHYCSPDIKCE